MPTSILPAFEADMSAAAAQRWIKLTLAYLDGTRDGTGPVFTPHAPGLLAARFDEPLPRVGRPLAEVADRVERDILSDINRLMHPMYMGHQVSAPLAACIWPEPLIAAMNQSLAVWEMSPTATVLETRLIRWMCDLAGFGEAAGGTLTSGGTEATFTALLAARATALPEAWTEGVGADPPVVLCGEHAHYAVTRAIGQLGLGMRRAMTIPSSGWRMDTGALAMTLDGLANEGVGVMAVVATAGSTATGSFDDLETIGLLCEERGIWLHVDGAHGASALLSAAQMHRLRGIHRARSIAWDPHQMMLLPLSAGMLLVRDEADLERAFAQRAPYLFHVGGGERSWDQGTRSFMCSRRADALKLWIALQRHGADGLGEFYDGLCATTRSLYEVLRERSDFVTVHEPESNILCFRWVGDGTLSDAQLDVANQDLRERYNRSGKGWITSTILGGRRVLRVTIMNARTCADHVRALVTGLADAMGS